MEEREPDLTDDPRKQDEGDGGYPEENPAGGGSGTHDERDDHPGPDTDAGQDDKPSDATGNPGAAGG
jgi:hypothetical protein